MSLYVEPMGEQLASVSGWRACKAWVDEQGDLPSLAMLVIDARASSARGLREEVGIALERDAPPDVISTLTSLAASLDGYDGEVHVSDGLTDQDITDDWDVGYEPGEELTVELDGLVLAYNPDQERDDAGRFGSGSGGARESSKKVRADLKRIEKEIDKACYDSLSKDSKVAAKAEARIKELTEELADARERLLSAKPSVVKDVGDVVPRRPFTPGKIRANITEEVNSKIEEHGLNGDKSVDEYRAEAGEHLQGLVDRAKVFVRVPEHAVLKVLEDSRMKSQHESGDSSGMFDPAWRKEAEATTMGVGRYSKDEDRPVYGYLSEDESGQVSRRNEQLANYGDIAFELKDAVKDSTTVTFGDSLDAEGSLIAEPMRAVTVNSYPVGNPEYGGQPLNATSVDMDDGYVEAQVHNGVRLADIERVHFPATSPARGIYAHSEIVKLLDGLNIPWTKAGVT